MRPNILRVRPFGWSRRRPQPARPPEPTPRTAAEVADETMGLIDRALEDGRVVDEYVGDVERGINEWRAAKARERG